jgi:hypothetical protein
MSKEKINEGLIDRFFGVFEKALKKSREKATAKALKDPKIQRQFKELKKDMDDIVKEMIKITNR